MDTIITDIEISEMPESNFIKPYSINFTQNGARRRWDCVKVHDSVSVLLYHEQKDAFLFVKQFRPAVWYNLQKEGLNSAEIGYTYELCAGLMDKGKSLEQTIREEAAEEVGYELCEVRRITTTYGSFGFGGNAQTMFYARINENMRVNEGGGIDGEDIKLVFIPRTQAKNFMYDESKVKGFGLLFALLWWSGEFCKSLE